MPQALPLPSLYRGEYWLLDELILPAQSQTQVKWQSLNLDLGNLALRAHFLSATLYWHAHLKLSVRTIYVPGCTRLDLVENQWTVKHPNTFRSWILCVTQGAQRCKRAETVYDLGANYNCSKKKKLQVKPNKILSGETSHFPGLSHTFQAEVTTILCVWKRSENYALWLRFGKKIFIYFWFDTFQNVTLKNNFFFSNNDISLLTSPNIWLVVRAGWELGKRGRTETYLFKVT